MKKLMLLGIVLVAAACGGKKKSGGGDGEGGGDPRSGVRSEAKIQVEKLFKGAKIYFETNGALPPSAPLTPPALACQGGTSTKHTPDPAFWAGTAFDEVAFQMDDPHYYSYELVTTADSVQAIAVGDLDCDSNPGSFTLSATVKDGQWTSSGLVENQPRE